MIRDPSDGSVKPEPSKLNAHPMAEQNPVIEAGMPTSGLREPSHRADYLARLDRSRDWLRKYRTNPEKVVREQGETGE